MGQTYSEVRRFSQHTFAEQICEAAGVVFQGIQPSYDEAEGLVLFAETGGSTLGIPVSGISVDAIQKRLADYAREQEQRKEERNRLL